MCRCESFCVRSKQADQPFHDGRSHDNSKFVSSGGDRSVFLWDVMAGNTIRRIAGHMGRINVVEFNEDASVVVSGSYDSTVRIWDLR